MATTDQKLHQVLNQLDVLQATVELKLNNIDKKVDKIAYSLDGDEGAGENPGLKIRVDRLSQHKDNTDKTFWVFLVAIIGLAVESLWNVLFRK